MNYPYIYAWKNNEKRATMYGRRCRVVVRSRMNSCEIEFEDGTREITSCNALRKFKARVASMTFIPGKHCQCRHCRDQRAGIVPAGPKGSRCFTFFFIRTDKEAKHGC